MVDTVTCLTSLPATTSLQQRQDHPTSTVHMTHSAGSYKFPTPQHVALGPQAHWTLKHS